MWRGAVNHIGTCGEVLGGSDLLQQKARDMQEYTTSTSTCAGRVGVLGALRS
jgi:hypothetical protein